jgi:protein phosphatase 4 regulatory subunit 3
MGAKLFMRAKDDPVTERFLEYFYSNCMDTLFRPLLEIPESKPPTGKFVLVFYSLYLTLKIIDPIPHFSRERTNLFLHLCELLANFTAQHSFHSHFYLISSNIASRMGSLLTAKDKHLRLGKHISIPVI